MTVRVRHLLDGALTVGIGTALIAEGIVHNHHAPPWYGYPLAVLTVVALSLRRRAPLASLLGVEAGAVSCEIAFNPHEAAIAAVMVALFTVALLGDRRRSLVVSALTAVLLVAIVVLIDGGTVELSELALQLVLLLAAVVGGDTVRSRRILRAVALEQAHNDEREREERTQRRLVAERMRIARDLHDTLAHALVAINVRSSVAARLHDRQDPAAALLDIKEVSADALRDLRATLHLLREQDEVAPVLPALDLEALPMLLERVRAGGLDAKAQIRMDGAAVPSPVGQAAFRIIQEALTNVMRHAHATTAQVEIDTSHGMLHLQVLDDGRGGVDTAPSGHGLRGMAERAAVLGGRVAAGPRPAGGWQVRAKLPLAANLDQR